MVAGVWFPAINVWAGKTVRTITQNKVLHRQYFIMFTLFVRSTIFSIASTVRISKVRLNYRHSNKKLKCSGR